MSRYVSQTTIQPGLELWLSFATDGWLERK